MGWQFPDRALQGQRERVRALGPGLGLEQELLLELAEAVKLKVRMLALSGPARYAKWIQPSTPG